MSRNKEVRLISTKRKYKTNPFYVVPVITRGQKEPLSIFDESLNIPELKGISGAQINKLRKIEKDIFLENDDLQYPLVNSRSYNLSQDDDFVMYLQLKYLIEEVAPSQSEFVKGKSYFYLHDEIEESEKAVNQATLKARAYTLVGQMGNDEIKNIALFLGIRINDGMHISVIKKQVFDRCESNPTKVLKYKEKSKQEDRLIYFRELMAKNIIIFRDGDFDRTLPENKRKGSGYYHDQLFLGKTESIAVKTVFDNQDIFDMLKDEFDNKTSE